MCHAVDHAKAIDALIFGDFCQTLQGGKAALYDQRIAPVTLCTQHADLIV